MDAIFDKVKAAMIGTGSWVDYQKQIRNGQCEEISRQVVKILHIMGINAIQVRGYIKYPAPVISNDIHEAETYELRHWWVEINGDIYEFAKGTLINGVVSQYEIDISDLESVTPPDGFEYHPECYI